MQYLLTEDEYKKLNKNNKTEALEEELKFYKDLISKLKLEFRDGMDLVGPYDIGNFYLKGMISDEEAKRIDFKYYEEIRVVNY